MTPWPSQIEMAAECYPILDKYRMVYLAGEERTGKLLASLLIAEMCPGVKKVLALTTKKALDGWKETLAEYDCIKEVTATNYHQAHKLKAEYDLVILDEAHNYLPGYPKRSKMWSTIAVLTKGLPIVYSSATPHAQGRQMLFNQFALSSYSPWRHKNFYSWFQEYGVENFIWLSGRQVQQYTEVQDDRIMSEVDHLFVTKTRKELGFKEEPKDFLHYIELDEATKNTYNMLLKDKYYKFLDGDELILDTPAKLNTTLQQLEGGACKITEIKNEKVVSTPKVLTNHEKITYIKNNWRDTKTVVIMYHFIAEGIKLREHFKHARILQGTSYAEGVDLSMYETLIIYSMDYRVSKYTQRRARQANRKRDTPIKVHYLLTLGGMSEQIYKAVAEKKINFVDSIFNKQEI